MKLRFLIPAIVFGALFAVFGLMLIRSENGGYDPKIIHSPLIGKAAPAYRLSSVEDPNRIVDSKEFLGQVYLVNVWGTWCVACRQEHGALLEIARQQVVPIVGIDTKGDDDADERANAQRWLATLGNPYAVTVFDGDGRVAIDFGVYGAPETFLVDANGIIVDKHIGVMTMQIWEKKFLPRIMELKKSERGS